jgi:hypothetical protein
MNKWTLLMVLLIIVGVALVALAIYYWVTPAGSLPSFFPGHLVGSAHKHVKHGVLALVLAALWLVLTALRRRVGIPLLPDGKGAAPRRDALLAGFALGALPVIIERAVSLATTRDIPDPPATLLDQLAPALAQGLGMPMAAGWTMAMIAIPALVIAGVSHRRSVTILLSVVLLALVAGLGATQAYRVAHPTVGAVLLGLSAPVAIFLAVRAWGSVCGWSWVVAALAWRGLASAHDAVHAATLAEHAAGAVGVVTAAALLYVAARRMILDSRLSVADPRRSVVPT